MRNFLIVSNHARSDGEFSLNDIPGTSGRTDMLARAVTSAFLTSHGIRKDVILHIIFLGEPDPPKHLRIIGSELKNLHPDERSTSALLQKALKETADEGWKMPMNGVYIRRAEMEIAPEMPKPLVLLAETGKTWIEGVAADGMSEGTFIMGDHLGCTDDQLEFLWALEPEELSLGPMSLHTDQCIVIVHNRLDLAIDDLGF